MDEQVAALEGFVMEMKSKLEGQADGLVLAQQVAAMELCIMLYKLIVRAL